MERLVQANSGRFVQITFSTLDADGTPHIHLDIANKGVGAARMADTNKPRPSKVKEYPTPQNPFQSGWGGVK